MNEQVSLMLTPNVHAVNTTTGNEETGLFHTVSCPSPSISSIVTSIPSTKLASQSSWPVAKRNGITQGYMTRPLKKLRTSSHLRGTEENLLSRDTLSKNRVKLLYIKFVRWHIGRWKRQISRSTIVFRCLSILLGLLLMIEFAIVNASQSDRSPSLIIQFLYGAEYPVYEITIIVYGSTAAALGISFEIYVFLIFAIVNVIMASLYCDELIVNVVYVVKLISLFASTELSYQNFRRLPHYNEALNQSAQYMLHQALLFSATMLFLVARGWRTVYLGANGTCAFQRDTCGFNDLYRPQFKASDPCEGTFIDYLSGREELRVLRNWVLLNMAFHAMFNQSLFHFTHINTVRWPLPRFIVRILFIALATSFIAVNIWSFEYHNFKIVFDIVECVLYVFTIGLMIYNLIPCVAQNTGEGQEAEPMQLRPNILPNY